ncbi:MAG: epoxyqueuosine reductase [Candidatus Thorarchaeota archaeon]
MSQQLTQLVKQKALDVGFVSVGITSPNRLVDLPHGWVGQVRQLKTPEEEFSAVKSIIVLAIHLWDKIFHLNVIPSKTDEPKSASRVSSQQVYFFGSEIMKNKAWEIIQLLRTQGYTAIHSKGIPLKSVAVQCGLGWQGKSTLLITPTYGPRVYLIAVLTDAELEYDHPFEQNLCGACDKCLKACPANALSAYQCEIHRCIVYALECPKAPEIPDKTQTLERQLTLRPTPHSYIECSMCMDVCPHGKPAKTTADSPTNTEAQYFLKPLVV